MGFKYYSTRVLYHIFSELSSVVRRVIINKLLLHLRFRFCYIFPTSPSNSAGDAPVFTFTGLPDSRL
jgi:hypothetical protein